MASRPASGPELHPGRTFSQRVVEFARRKPGRPRLSADDRALKLGYLRQVDILDGLPTAAPRTSWSLIAGPTIPSAFRRLKSGSGRRADARSSGAAWLFRAISFAVVEPYECNVRFWARLRTELPPSDRRVVLCGPWAIQDRAVSAAETWHAIPQSGVCSSVTR